MAVLPIIGAQSLAQQNAAATTSPPASSMFSKSAAPISFVSDTTPTAPIQTAGKAAVDEKTQKFKEGAQAGYYGLQAAGGVTPTPDSNEAMASALSAGAAGAIAGASIGPVGAAVGGGVGLVLGGLNAYLGMKSARKAKDKEAALTADAIRMNKEEIARDEKWRVQNHLDSMEQARYDRKKYAMQQAYQASQNQGKNMMALINANAGLKDRFAKLGY